MKLACLFTLMALYCLKFILPTFSKKILRLYPVSELHFSESTLPG